MVVRRLVRIGCKEISMRWRRSDIVFTDEGAQLRLPGILVGVNRHANPTNLDRRCKKFLDGSLQLFQNVITDVGEQYDPDHGRSLVVSHVRPCVLCGRDARREFMVSTLHPRDHERYHAVCQACVDDLVFQEYIHATACGCGFTVDEVTR